MIANLDTTKGVPFHWQIGGGHGSRHPLRNA